MSVNKIRKASNFSERAPALTQSSKQKSRFDAAKLHGWIIASFTMGTKIHSKAFAASLPISIRSVST